MAIQNFHMFILEIYTYIYLINKNKLLCNQSFSKLKSILNSSKKAFIANFSFPLLSHAVYMKTRNLKKKLNFKIIIFK